MHIASFPPNGAQNKIVLTTALYLIIHLQSVLAFSSPDIVVIGGGSAGLTAAKFGARFGKRVILVERDQLGGDCTWTGCVPSKSLIAEAKKIHMARKAMPDMDATLDWQDVKERLKHVIRRIYEADDSPTALESLNIAVVKASASFVDEETLLLQGDDGNETLSAKYGYIVSTGARPFIPNIQGLEISSGVEYVTYEQVFDLPELPPRLTVIGGGPIGCEMAQTFQRLGSEVTIIAPSLLPGEDPEAGDVLKRVFEAEGIRLVLGKVVSVETSSEQAASHAAIVDTGERVTGDTLLVATGRSCIVEELGLENAGVEFSKKGIRTNSKLQTTSKKIYAAGDCTGGPQFTHVAGFQGAIAARNLLLPLSDPGVPETPVPSCVFTSPEVASTGFSEALAQEKFGDQNVRTIFRKLCEIDRGLCDDNNPEGFIKITYHAKDFRILGALIVAPPAGDMISELSVAMAGGVKLPALASIIHPYPSYSIAIQQMAAEVYYGRLEKTMPLYNLLKRFGL